MRNVFLFDTRLYHSLLRSLSAPGALARDYIEGRRKGLIAPFPFFLFFMTLYLLVMAYFGEDFMQVINQNLGVDVEVADEAKQLQGMVRRNINLLYLILTPLLALFTRWLNRSMIYSYAEVFLFSLYAVGAACFISLFVLLGGALWAPLYNFRTLVIFVFYPFAVYSFVNRKGFLAALRSFLVVLLTFVSYSFLIVVLAFVYFAWRRSLGS